MTPRSFTVEQAVGFPPAALADAFNAGFGDYPLPFHFDTERYLRFVLAHDIRPELSFVALSGGQIVGIVQVGRRGDAGWIGGLAVLPAHRRRGIGRALMETATAAAFAAGIRTLSLEVLAQNEAALRLYERLGWRHDDELLTWYRPLDQDLLPVPGEFLEAVDAAAILSGCFHWHDRPLCWQRQQRTLQQLLDDSIGAWAILRNGRPVAYALGRRPHNGRLHLLDVAVDPQVGIRSAGRPLLQALYHTFRQAVPLLANEPVDSHLNHLFVALGYRVLHRQYALRLDG
ncbi:MAG: GNAT family N-acetyltransferase [Anaerolineae bacterium]|nr:GNAT family N-acetyltransferase [Caldilineales bacterium]MDW8270383.1 GNAT family N-acetyltransferase [Anaerolineae bacterium]